MDENHDCGSRPGQPHWRDEPKPGQAAINPKAEGGPMQEVGIKGEREAFEAWASGNGAWPEIVERSRNGIYRMAQIHAGWQAWEARAAVDTGAQEEALKKAIAKWFPDRAGQAMYFAAAFFGHPITATEVHARASLVQGDGA